MSLTPADIALITRLIAQVVPGQGQVGDGFSDAIVAGTTLVIPDINSPNFVSGVSGWSVNKDGTAQFNQLTLIVSVSGAAVLIYSGTAQLGSLIGSWAGTAGTDAYGNAYPQGLSATGGVLNSATMNGPTIWGAIINNALLSAPAITDMAATGGKITETAITFDTVGGVLLCYATTTTTQTISSAGQTLVSIPAGITVGKVECWGADAGAGGGSASQGGEGGGGGEYACYPSYPLAGGGQMLALVGAGGQGGTTGNGGSGGGDTIFDNTVIAQGGQAGSGFTGGLGGFYNLAPVDFAGGNGGGDTTQSTGGCGGGGRAGSASAGSNGGTSNSSGGSGGGAAGTGTGGHVGGNGGNAAANGSNGGGGGGAGAGSGSTQGQNTYRLSASETFYGADANGGAPPNGRRASGTMWSGGETASGGAFNGTMKSMGIISGSPSADLAGKTIDTVKIRLEQTHCWYNSGAYIALGYTGNTSVPATYNGSSTGVKSWWQGPATDQGGGPRTTDLTGAGLGSALQSGAARAIVLGPGTPAFDLYNYCSVYGAGGSNSENPLITVNWHTGAAPQTAGNGADGQIVLTYSSTITLASALSPAAGSDAAGNAYGAGYTGPVQNFHPGSSPTTAESWQTVTNPAGWSGTIRVKKLAEANFAYLDVAITNAGTSGNITSGNFPSGYAVASAKNIPIAILSNTAPANSNQRGLINLSTGISSFGTFALPAGTTGVFCQVVYPLD